MNEYAKFLVKRIIHRKSNLILIFGVMILISVFLVMNINSQNELQDVIVNQIKLDYELIETNQKRMIGLLKDSEEFVMYKCSIEEANLRIQSYETALNDYQEKEWINFYNSYISILEQQKQINEDTLKIVGEDDLAQKGMLDYLDKQLEYIKYLKENQLDYQNLDYPIFGLSFTTSLFQIFLPVIITISCIYILIQIFMFSNLKGIDIDDVLPIGKKRIVLVKNILGVGVSLSIYMFIILFTFILATLFTHNIGFEYPILLQNQSDGTWYAVKAISLFKDWCIIGLLFYINLSLFTYILSLFLKEEGTLLLTILCFVLGLAYLPNVIEFLRGFAHILPTTYMSLVNVVIGDTALLLNNNNISTLFGILVLLICFLLQGIFIIIYQVKASIQ